MVHKGGGTDTDTVPHVFVNCLFRFLFLCVIIVIMAVAKVDGLRFRSEQRNKLKKGKSYLIVLVGSAKTED